MGTGQAQRREHFWDAARALLMLLGIPYHVALSYQADSEWIVVSREGAPFFTYLAQFIHLFRMPAFFVIAGYFAALLLSRRSPEIWLKGRLSRLGIPFLATIVLLVPPLNMVAELSNLPPAEAVASWRHSSLSSGGYWVRHLWFIIVLLYCSLGAAVLVWRRPSLATAILPFGADKWMARHFLVTLLACAIVIGLWEGGAIELFYVAGLATNVPQQILRIDELLTYAPYFVLGFVLSRSPALYEKVGRFSPVVLGIAVLFTGIAMATSGQFWPPVGRFIGTIAAVALTQVVIALTRRFLDRPMPMVQRLVSASFVIYLVHMPIVVLLIWVGQYVAMPVPAKAVAVMLATFTLSYGFWIIVERVPLMAFLFNGEPLARRAAPQRYAVSEG